MSEVLGPVHLVKETYRKQLIRLSQFETDPKNLILPMQASRMIKLSQTLSRPIGVVLDRSGHTQSVVLGQASQIRFPQLDRFRSSLMRLSGYRFVYTQLGTPRISQDNINDLLVFRLDALAQLYLDEQQIKVSLAHLSRDPSQTQGVEFLKLDFHNIHFNVHDWILDLENTISQKTSYVHDLHASNLAIVCALKLKNHSHIHDDIEELKSLCNTAGLKVVGEVIQSKGKPEVKYLMGQGKITQIASLALQREADYIVFLQNLSPGQALNISKLSNLKVIDRTQLILDIFAKRAKSFDGKLQVELAQLKYNLPRLKEKESSLSRLTGGIGGRGPGETTLEIHQRRARDKINKLEKQIKQLEQKRHNKRQLRSRRNIPVVSIVGYTNAGKSTLLNTLTHADALAENKLFATLDPFSKLLREPRQQEIILTDTVGFIQNLPPDLIQSFKATLEEISMADLLLHVVDASHPRFDFHIHTVNQILKDLNCDHIEKLLVFNKVDLMDFQKAKNLCETYSAIGISAIDKTSCQSLLSQMFNKLISKASVHALKTK